MRRRAATTTWPPRTEASRELERDVSRHGDVATAQRSFAGARGACPLEEGCLAPGRPCLRAAKLRGSSRGLAPSKKDLSRQRAAAHDQATLPPRREASRRKISRASHSISTLNRTFSPACSENGSLHFAFPTVTST